MTHISQAETRDGRPRPRTGIRFTAKDFVNVAIFAAIYIVFNFVITMLGIVSPVVMVITLPLAGLFGGVIYMLFLTRARHAGMVTLFGVVVALGYLIAGHPWQSFVWTIIVTLIAELTFRAGKYRSRIAAIWTTGIFTLWTAGPWIPFFMNREAYVRSDAVKSMGAEYARQFDQVLSYPLVIGVVLATCVIALLGALLGSAMLRKHFVRAGLA